MASDFCRFAVTGRPVLHSLSPALFGSALAAAGQPGWYVRLAAESAPEALEVARALGLRGLNVTAPFKEDMLLAVDEIDDEARELGAVNTVVFAQGRTRGYNTDPQGVTAQLQTVETAVDGRKAVVLGAGGAARSAVVALRQAGCAEVVICNRTIERAERLAVRFHIRCTPWERAAEELRDADLIVSCLPAGVPVPAEWRWPRTSPLLDASYVGSALAPLARRLGAPYVDGRAWLVGQAVAASRLWCGHDVSEATMSQGLEHGAKHKDSNAWRRLALTGMMGTGKTTVGRALARSLGWTFVDTDEEIQRQTGCSIADLFAREGEARFRQEEARVTQELLLGQDTVVALGGGALIDANTRSSARRQATVVWLWASASCCTARAADGSRPLLAVPSPVQVADRLLAQRSPLYGAACDLVLSTENRAPEQAARKIIEELQHMTSTDPRVRVADER